MVEEKKARLSDLILTALKRSLEQEDREISELLTKALERSMTRKADGEDLVERREYPEEIEAAMGIFSQMTDGNRGSY